MEVVRLVTLLLMVQACLSTCPVFHVNPVVWSASPGTVVLQITVNENAAVSVCTPSPVTASPTTLTGNGTVTLSTNSFVGLSKIGITVVDGACTNTTNVRFYVDPASTSAVKVGTNCSTSGENLQLSPQNTVASPRVYFVSAATSCATGFVLNGQRCVSL
eukprot:CAMPEP_0114553428 /NCGR_PEP_ID=MMETSP0114-20121206/7656_1 /TAXON_ID=31324 /ORGANISM="Goniomonas sp, Strain m" /LENGTH=159 /DNA_ID=CAMNT_0001738377 /DNA_START=12 /DNA_END=491 /DNA_ORIENTATION=-